MRKFRPLIGLIAVCLTLSGCDDGPEEFTLQEFQHLVQTRYTKDSVDCGTSDTTNGYSEQSNPEVVTCFHNALANGQFAHGFFVFGNTYSLKLVFSHQHHIELDNLIQTVDAKAHGIDIRLSAPNTGVVFKRINWPSPYANAAYDHFRLGASCARECFQA